MSRIDNVAWYSIDMKINLYFTGGPHKELIVLWETCGRRWDRTVGYMPQCNNSTSCTLNVGFWRRFAGNYLTSARISYLSCVNGRWKTQPVVIAMRNYDGSHGGWTW